MAPVDLYMGCGKKTLDGFLHADIYPYPNVDVVCDATKEWPWPDNTFNRVFTRDFMEHLPPLSGVHVINEMWRVLKPGGTMEHYIPNAGSRNDFGSPSHLSHWNLQVFEHFDIDSYRYDLDREYEGIKGPWRKVFAELVTPRIEDNGFTVYQSIHVRYQTVK